MASQLEASKIELTIYGYIRENFEEKCLVGEILQTIIIFHNGKSGSLYVFGYGEDGCLGVQKYADKICKTPTLCPPFNRRNVKDVSSPYHTLILDIDGNVWSCGNGGCGQLGTKRGYEKGNLNVPMRVELNYRVIAVSAGDEHSLLLCDNGNVYGFGSNYYGQIGMGNLGNSFVPKLIERLSNFKIVQISAYGSHSGALAEDGDLFCFGDNQCGECGIGQHIKEKVTIPTKVRLSETIAFIECGISHTLLITRCGLIYSFGQGWNGRLGHGDHLKKWVPTLIEDLKQRNIKICSAGLQHSLCLDEEGIIWSFGSNTHGQCGLSMGIEQQLTPKRIQWFAQNNIKAKDCTAGSQQSCVIAYDSTLFVFGSNRKFQLGLKEQCHYFQPTKLSFGRNVKIEKVSLGHDHTTVVCSL